MTDNETIRPVCKRPRRMARTPEADPAQAIPRRTTKSELVIMMLSAAGGASLDELIAATGWLPHSARAALTGLKKKGHNVTSEKLGEVRRYRIEGGVA